MTVQHIIDYYQDGFAAIPFCKNCSAEADQLHDPCKPIETERNKVARYLNLDPDKPKTWPLDIIDGLIFIEHREGKEKMLEEIRKLNKFP